MKKLPAVSIKTIFGKVASTDSKSFKNNWRVELVQLLRRYGFYPSY